MPAGHTSTFSLPLSSSSPSTAYSNAMSEAMDVTNSPVTNKRPKQVLPPLAKFNGNRIQYESWVIQAKQKLLVDGEAIGSPYAQVAVVYGALTDHAAVASATFISEMGPEGTAEDLIRHLDKLYADPHKKQAAMRKWNALKQGSRSFSAFYSEFEKLMYEAGANRWGNEPLIDKLLCAVSDELVGRLVGRTPEDYETLVAELRRTSNDLERLKQLRKSSASTSMPISPRASPTVSRHTTDDMEWEPTPTKATFVRAMTYGRATNPLGHPTGPGLASDVNLIGKRAKWVTRDVISRRRDTGVCLRCGRQGFRLQVCPLSAAISPAARQGRTGIRTSQTTIIPEPSLEEMVDDEDNSETCKESKKM